MPFGTPRKLLSVQRGQDTAVWRNAAPRWRKCCPALYEMLSQAFNAFLTGRQGLGKGGEQTDLEKQDIKIRLGSISEGMETDGGSKNIGVAVIQKVRLKRK